jgi:CBS domain-containing protein
MVSLNNHWKTALFTLMILIIPLAHAETQPILPTYIFGKVVDLNSNPLGGIMVTATWTDVAGEERSRTTKTLDDTSAEYESVIGHYFFNQGYIQAKEGTQIKITVREQEKKIYADPGGNPASVEVITVDIGGVAPEDEKEDNKDEQKKEGSADGSAGDDTSGEVSDLIGKFDVSLYLKSMESGKIPNINTQPTMVYGQLLDEKGNPVGGEMVEVQWVDNKGIRKIKRAVTLTEVEAKRLGDASLEGHYMVDMKNATEEKNITTLIKPIKSRYSTVVEKFPEFNRLSSSSATEEASTTVKKDLTSHEPINTDSDGKIVKKTILERISEFLLGNKKSENKMESSSFLETSSQIAESANNLIKKNLNFIIIFFTSILVVLVIFGRNEIMRRQKQLVKTMNLNRLKRNISRLYEKKVLDFMVRDIVVVVKEDSVDEVINTFIMFDIGCIVVVEGKNPVGMITERDIFRKIDFSKVLTKLKAKDIMSKPVLPVESNASLNQILDLCYKHNIRKLPVVRNKELIGIITLTDILKEYQQFLSDFISEGSVLPKVRNIMSHNYIPVNPEANLLETLNRMLKKDADSVLVVGKEEHLEGILTERDVLKTLYNCSKISDKLTVDSVMTRKLFNLTPGTNIKEANREMIEKNVRRMPVVEIEKIAGIVTQKDILDELKSFTSELIRKQA